MSVSVPNPIRVLHLEDDPLDAELIRHELEIDGVRCDIVLAHGADSFEAALAAHSFDLILCDYNVPGYDGIAGITRAREQQPDAPVIVISGTLGEEAAVKCLHLGATDYLIKQHLERLAPAVRRAVQEAEEHRSRKEAERALQLRERLLSSIYETVANVLFCLEVEQDGRYRFTTINQAFVSTTGLEYSQVAGRRVDEVIPEPSLSQVLKHYRDAIQERRVVRWEETSAYPKGLLTGEVSIAPVFDAAGRCTHLVGAVHDITARKQAEKELRQAEAKFRSLTEGSLVGVSIIQDERFRYVNPALTRITGYSQEEMLAASSVLDLQVPEEDQPLVRENLRRRQDGEAQHVRFNSHIRRKDGSLVTVDILGSQIPFEGRPAVMSTVLDITAREQAEEALMASERRYAALVRNLEGIVWEADAQTFQFTFVSEYAEKLLGYPLGRWSEPMFWRDHIHPEDRDAAVRHCLDSTRRGEAHDFEYRMLASDGRAVWLRDLATVEMAGGHPLTLRGVMVDVTTGKRVEAQLREAQDQLQLAVSAGKVGLWTRDLRTNSVRFSPEWKRQIGYVDHEIADDVREWQSRVHPDDLDRVRAVQLASLSGAESAFEVEFRLRHKDGSYRHVLSRGSTVRGNDGAPGQLVGANVDITEWTTLQAQFRQAQRMESLGQLAGGIAHDFNNLLTVINGTAELAAARVADGDPLQADLQEIRREGDRAAALTRQLLAFGRKQILQRRALNLNTVVAEMETMLRTLIGEQIDLVFAPAEGLGSVKADPGQMEQVIVNLAVNARDAMPQGGQLTIEAKNVEVDEYFARQRGVFVKPGSYVMLAVSDTGVGMDEVTRKRVFEPFFTTKGPGKGTGLGLSTVYGIVKQSDGLIWLYSEVGQGTSVKIYLPQVADVAADDRPSSTVATTHGTETILVVEDVGGLRNLARRILESAGYTVLTAANGEEALSVLTRREQPVHLMVTDVVMPGMSGRTLVEQSDRTHPCMKVLYMSGYTGDAVMRHGVLDARVPFLGKPFTAADLLRKVREVLDAQA